MLMSRLLALVLAFAVALPAAAERVHRYSVRVDAQLSAVRVQACFDGAPPLTLVTDSLDAAGDLQEAHVDVGGRRLAPNGAELTLGPLPPGSCVTTVSALVHVGNRHQRERSAGRRVGGDLLSEVGQWLWRPPDMAVDEDIELRFELPEGIAVSAPWRPVRDASGAVSAYRLGRAPIDWPAVVAFGRFTPREIDVAGARLRVAVLHGSPALEWEFVRQWLTHAAQTVASLYGRMPVDDLQVVVVPGARGDEPVPSAYVLRGGQPSLHFFVNQRRSLDEFLQDWSAVHEMAHLFLPYVQPQDAWLSEGLASYYQHVLRARAGTITAQEAWQQLDRNFRRASRSMPALTLAAATERMHRDGAFLRVYWEGAALMLMADQRLRERTQGRQSLDAVLRSLRECCLQADVAWQARGLFDKLDALSGTTVFSELYALQASERSFPDLGETYAQLGLRAAQEGAALELLPAASQQRDRDAIMAAPAR